MKVELTKLKNGMRVVTVPMRDESSDGTNGDAERDSFSDGESGESK